MEFVCKLCMACYHPVPAYQAAGGEVTFAERRQYGSVRSLWLPCGQCIGCRLERSRQWAVRCMHEASLYDENSFVLLTYSDEFLPDGGSLVYRDFQLFMKRLRKHFKGRKISYFVAGEYGDDRKRPHFHACLFNVGFYDMKYFKKSPSGYPLYRSELLEKLWPYGHCTIGTVTFESAGYVARYCLKKITGEKAEAHYEGRVPEFARMSLNPAIGKKWFERFIADVRDGKVVVNGKKARMPRYYDGQLERVDPDGAEWLQYQRELEGKRRAGDNTDARLLVREEVEVAKFNFKRGDRGIDRSFGKR